MLSNFKLPQRFFAAQARGWLANHWTGTFPTKAAFRRSQMRLFNMRRLCVLIDKLMVKSQLYYFHILYCQPTQTTSVDNQIKKLIQCRACEKSRSEKRLAACFYRLFFLRKPKARTL